jgi:hypothetical protein
MFISFVLAASPPEQTKKTGFSLLPQAKHARRGASKPFNCFGFGSVAAKTKAKEVIFLAAAGEKARAAASSNADRVRSYQCNE